MLEPKQQATVANVALSAETVAARHSGSRQAPPSPPSRVGLDRDEGDREGPHLPLPDSRRLRDIQAYLHDEPIMRHVVDVRRRCSGEDHPDTLDAMNSLGLVLCQTHQLPEARQLLSPSLEGMRRTLGPDHPKTLEAETWMLALFSGEQRYAEAEPLARRNLEANRRVYGSDHPKTLSALGNLSLNLVAQNKVSEGTATLREYLEQLRRIRGAGYSHAVVIGNALANLLVVQGEYAEGEQIRAKAWPPLRKL